MDLKKDLKQEEKSSNLTLENRKKITISGVIEVISFNDEKIILNTTKGMLTIKGMGLKMNKLDVQNGDVLVVGEGIDSLIYSLKNAPKEKESIWNKLFK